MPEDPSQIVAPDGREVVSPPAEARVTQETSETVAPTPGVDKPDLATEAGTQAERAEHAEHAEPKAAPPNTDDTSAPAEAGEKKKRRRRRKKKASTQPAPATQPSAESALAADEVEELRRNLAIVREYQSEFKLELSESELALLTGEREPTHRGVCEHLLSKVTEPHVLGALASLDTKQQAHLAGEVCRFLPSLPVLEAYLEATSALGQSCPLDALAPTLRRVNLEGLSVESTIALVKRAVDAIRSEDRCALLLLLLDHNQLAGRFQDWEPSLPSEVRAEASAISQAMRFLIRGDNPGRDYQHERVLSGLESLLANASAQLLRRPSLVRERVLRFALRHLPATHALGTQIDELLSTFDLRSARGGNLELLRIGGLLRHGDDAQAKTRLERLVDNPEVRSRAHLWLRGLSSPRIGRIALLRGRSGRKTETDAAVLRPAFCLSTQRRLWVRVGTESDAAEFSRHVDIVKRALVPGIVPEYSSNVTSRRGPYVAYLAKSASSGRLQISSTLGEDQLLTLALDGVTMLAALAQLGIVLPDASADRFELDPSGRLWLLDLWRAELVEPKTAITPMLRLASRWCESLILDMPFVFVDDDTASILRSSGDFATLMAGIRRVGQRYYAD